MKGNDPHMKKSIDAIRFLGMDMINKANSGHPGIVLGAAPILYHLFRDHMKATPEDPDWFDRDRFVLSAGHGSALIYALLHYAGYDVGIEDLKAFRQLGSKTPGHPEYGYTEGIEATTGPLGQGIANAVGMAIAEAHLAERFNKDGLKVVDHFTYVLMGDGDFQEGVAQESMSLAGHLRLGKLVVLFDSNDVQLDGPTEDATSDDIRMKVESMNWHYEHVADANDLEALHKAIERAKQADKPGFIEVKSVIGEGSTVAGTSAAHGKPLGEEETASMRQAKGFTYGPFETLDEVYEGFASTFKKRGDAARADWQETLAAYKEADPETHEEFMTLIEGKVTLDFDEVLPQKSVGTAEATRNSMGECLEVLGNHLPALIGGSADLSGSTKAKGNDGDFTKTNRFGRNINFGVREHAMGAITNGLVLHGMKAFCGGFLIFSDYMKASMRLSALSSIPTIHIFTHDSVAVGEDGPTHEPIEQLAAFRATPNMNVIRPANAIETRHALRFAVESEKTPTLIALTRQKTTALADVAYADFRRGAYVVRDHDQAEGTLLASGSEVELALAAADRLEEEGVNVRVVSMPSMELFLDQPDEVQKAILPKDHKILAVEMAASLPWYRFTGHVMGIDSFGESGKGEEIVRHFGFTPETVARRFKSI